MLNSMTILGSSSGRNAGDAALVSGIMDSVDLACGKGLRYEIPSVRPSYIRDNYPNDAHPVGMTPWRGAFMLLGIPTYRSIMSTDLSVVYDAVLFDRSLYNPLFNYLSSLWLLLRHAKKKGKRIGCFNVGAGPVHSKDGQKMLRELCNDMDFVTVRDDDSANLLHEIGVTNPNLFVTADAALTVNPSSKERIDEIIQREGIPSSGEILGINVNRYLDTWASKGRKSIGREEFLKRYSEALNRVLKKIGVPTLFVCTQPHDIPLTKELMSMTVSPSSKHLITNERYNHYDIKGVLGRISMLFAMRLHANIFASSEGTPIVALLFQPKVKSYLDSLTLGDHTLSFDNFHVDAIEEAIMKGWNARQETRRILSVKIPELQGRARTTANLVAELHRGVSLENAIKIAFPDPGMRRAV